MTPPRIFAIGTAVLILGLTLASGPFVGVSLIQEDDFDPATGSLDATVASTPETATLDAAKYTVEGYHLRAPPIQLQIDDIAGQPIISYDISIHELGHTRSTIVFLDPSVGDTYTLELEPKKLAADRIEQDEYSGTIEIVINDDNGERTLIETDVQIEVRE